MSQMMGTVYRRIISESWCEMYQDNYDRFLKHDQEQQEWLENRPVCGICGEPVQEESYHLIDGVIYCDRCLADMKVYVEV